MSIPVAIMVDFTARRRRPRAWGVLLCAAGVLACTALGYDFQTRLSQRARVQARLSVMMHPHRAAGPTHAGDAAAAVLIATQLRIPWSRLLAELETASQDVASTVSLLEVQPDAAKHVVRITAEARTLPDALAYLERLQKSPVLRYPMLDSHELRKDDPEHPIRVKLTAEWRT